MFDTMTLDEMYRYRGKREVPADFDQFWDEELAKVDSIPTYQLIEKTFAIPNCHCYELWFDGTNEAKVFAKVVKPANQDNVPVLFYFHGYQGSSPDWSQCLNYVAAGFAVVCMDVRGQSGRSIDQLQVKGNTVKGQIIRGAIEGRDQLFFKDVYLDCYQLVNIIAQLDWVDEKSLMTYGASQGGALAVVTGALNPKISRVATIYPFLSDYARVLELGDKQEAYNELFRYFKFFDPYHETEAQLLDTLAYIDVKNLAHRIKVPVQMHVSLQDDVCPPSTQFAIYNRIESEKEVHVLREYSHEGLNVLVNDVVFNWLVATDIEVSKTKGLYNYE
ncbi:acetylxylan esterase [Aerococcaceae bacterium zg-BR9]|uniref:acetylxylan esterase n=1 Tax=Aerococcaceae bacterium zg-1292 TaxID=2774330 RepID=UPI004062DCB0|nr:acetylxylan esterase [Aerococcaceae bacterium zg-BR9]